MKLTKDEQLKIMRAQLSRFPSLMEKMQYMNIAFDTDPNFSQEARDQIRAEIAKTLKNDQ